jgi:hypothetical protein
MQAKVVVITGASSGVGRACAREFARRGARLGLSLAGGTDSRRHRARSKSRAVARSYFRSTSPTPPVVRGPLVSQGDECYTAPSGNSHHCVYLYLLDPKSTTEPGRAWRAYWVTDRSGEGVRLVSYPSPSQPKWAIPAANSLVGATNFQLNVPWAHVPPPGPGFLAQIKPGSVKPGQTAWLQVRIPGIRPRLILRSGSFT